MVTELLFQIDSEDFVCRFDGYGENRMLYFK